MALQKLASQTWQTFLKDHVSEIIAMDFFTVPTATFRVLFVLLILSHGRRILHFNATEHPSVQWIARQVLEACGTDFTPRFLLCDNDSIYGMNFRRQAAALGINEITTGPWCMAPQFCAFSLYIPRDGDGNASDPPTAEPA